MKTAIIGTGRMGQRHIQAARSMSLDIVGICDQSAENLALAAAQCNVPQNRCFSDIAPLLETARPECVIVSTTAPSHCDYTCLAAQSGVRYILCEKPMGISLAQCDHMIATCDKHGARLAINHQMRFLEQYTLPKGIAQSEAFGGLTSITVVSGNMGMAMNGLHYFEMFRFLADENPAEVTAWFSPEKVSNPRGPQYEDRAGAIRVTTPTGKRLYMEMGADQGHGISVVYAGKYGQILVDEPSGTMHIATREAAHRDLPTTRYGMPSEKTVHLFPPIDMIAATRSVLQALFDGQNYPTPQEARQAIAILVAAYESHEQGHRPVSLNASLPIHRTFPWA